MPSSTVGPISKNIGAPCVLGLLGSRRRIATVFTAGSTRIRIVEPQSSIPTREKRDIPWTLIGFAVLAVYAVLIIVLNREQVDISFVFFSTRISKLVLILLCLGIGFAGGFLFDRWRVRRNRRSA